MPDIGGRQSVMPEPSAVISAFSAYMSSTAARSPAMAPTLLPPPEALIALAIAAKASSQRRGLQLAVLADIGPVEPLALEAVPDEAGLVRDPLFVDAPR